MNFLDLLGIHEYDIECCKKRIQDALEEIGCDTDELEERAENYLIGETIDSDLGDQIISAMLYAGESIAREYAEQYGYELEIETYCNGADSHFSIKQESIDILNAIRNNPDVQLDTIIWLNEHLAKRDFDEMVSDAMVLRRLDRLSGEERDNLCSSDYENHDISDEEIEKKEKEMFENPDDPSKVWFMTASGQIWEMDD